MKVIIEKTEFQAAVRFTKAAMQAAKELTGNASELEAFTRTLQEYEDTFETNFISDEAKAKAYLDFVQKHNRVTGTLCSVTTQDDGSIILWINPDYTVRVYEILEEEVDFFVGILTSLYGLIKMFKTRIKKVEQKLNKIMSDLSNAK